MASWSNFVGGHTCMNISWFWLTNRLLLLPQIILVLFYLCSRNSHSLRMRLEQRKAVERLGRDYLASLNMWCVTCTCVRVGLRWASAKWWRQLATPKKPLQPETLIILAACVMYVIVVPWVSRVYEICTLRIVRGRRGLITWRVQIPCTLETHGADFVATMIQCFPNSLVVMTGASYHWQPYTLGCMERAKAVPGWVVRTRANWWRALAC